jgi:cold shock CspA family protein
VGYLPFSLAQGRAKWFSQEKGYGFITLDEGVRTSSEVREGAFLSLAIF